MLKTQSLWNGAESNHRDRILGEVEIIALLLWQAKGAAVGSCLKNRVPTEED